MSALERFRTSGSPVTQTPASARRGPQAGPSHRQASSPAVPRPHPETPSHETGWRFFSDANGAALEMPSHPVQTPRHAVQMSDREGREPSASPPSSPLNYRSSFYGPPPAQPQRREREDTNLEDMSYTSATPRTAKRRKLYARDVCQRLGLSDDALDKFAAVSEILFDRVCLMLMSFFQLDTDSKLIALQGFLMKFETSRQSQELRDDLLSQDFRACLIFLFVFFHRY